MAPSEGALAKGSRGQKGLLLLLLQSFLFEGSFYRVRFEKVPQLLDRDVRFRVHY